MKYQISEITTKTFHVTADNEGEAMRKFEEYADAVEKNLSWRETTVVELISDEDVEITDPEEISEEQAASSKAWSEHMRHLQDGGDQGSA